MLSPGVCKGQVRMQTVRTAPPPAPAAYVPIMPSTDSTCARSKYVCTLVTAGLCLAPLPLQPLHRVRCPGAAPSCSFRGCTLYIFRCCVRCHVPLNVSRCVVEPYPSEAWRCNVICSCYMNLLAVTPYDADSIQTRRIGSHLVGIIASQAQVEACTLSKAANLATTNTIAF